MYNINDIIIYNNQVCKIKETKEFNETKYYVLNPVSDDTLKINVPFKTADENFKNIMTKEEAANFIKKIPNIDVIEDEDRFIEQRYKELLKSGEKENIIKVIKTTYLRNRERVENKKKKSEKDMEYFERAEKLLYSEMMYSLSLSFDGVRDYIISYCE